ncbi:MAG: STAS domain-containing protein [Gammaproteobacteria bacterium]
MGRFNRPSSRVRLSSEGAGRFRLEGEVDFDTAMHLLHESRAMFKHEERVYLDFSGVDRINSAGLALVIEWLREARRESRTLEICNPPEGLMAMARICDVEDLIQTLLAQSDRPAKPRVWSAPSKL